ncbi:hypothetical protein F4Z99_19335 [Candidatus Poribacteria bacterium]|nr:hypothetical protein [Candidatus Poribacteria bacterium]MYA98638.1 hypothetical protein [Candidatus Poribacteria bacterium]
MRRSSREAPLSVKVVRGDAVRGVDFTPVVFDSEAYDRTIIDNNLFRPLGWTPRARVNRTDY